MNAGLSAQLQEYWLRYRDDGILLDTNLLLLLWLAQFDPSLVGGKRLAKYTSQDVQLLATYVHKFSRILTTHTILTETSNLAALVLTGQRKREFFTRLFPLFVINPPPKFQRCPVEGLTLDAGTFVDLGFTDATLVATAETPHFLLTDDLDLYLAAQSRGAPTVNFTHMREAVGIV